MLEGYIYYYAWFWIVISVLASIIPGPGPQSTQSTRMISSLLALPLIGRILGWW